MSGFRFRVLASCFLIAVTLPAGGARADTYPRQPGVDAVHYVFRLTLGDASDQISGETTATLKLAAGVTEAFLDLTSVTAGKGMAVSSVTLGGKAGRVHAPVGPSPHCALPCASGGQPRSR